MAERIGIGAGGRRGAATGLLIVLGGLLAGCSARPEQAEIGAAQAAVERARQAEAGIWAPEDLRAAEEALNEAIGAIAAEEGKWFSSYDRARELLGRAEEEAAGAAEAAIAGKAKARADAEATIASAEAALGEARSRLDAAPAGRLSRGDRSAFRADLEALPRRLEEARTRLQAGEIREALEEATGAERDAAALADRIEESLRGPAEPPPK
jgi:hypothetical protein